MAWTNLLAFISGSPGASWDSDHAQEIIDNTPDFEVVSGNFAGATGSTAVAITDKGNTNYGVSIVPLTSDPSAVGSVSFEATSSTEITIYNSGSSTCAFRAVIFAVA